MSGYMDDLFKDLEDKFNNMLGDKEETADSGINASPDPHSDAYYEEISNSPDTVSHMSDHRDKRDERERENDKKKPSNAHQLKRPELPCIECGHSFKQHHAFHWTDQGPIHGWGGREDLDTCHKKKYLRCEECSEFLFFDEPYHRTHSGWVHGKGTRSDSGTCLVAYRRNLSNALAQVADQYVSGDISDNDVLFIQNETRDHQKEMEERLETAEKNAREAKKKREKEEKEKGKKKKKKKHIDMYSPNFDPRLTEDDTDDDADLS